LLLGEENEKDIEFYFFDAGGHPIFKPIIDGVVRICLYLSAESPSLKMLIM